MISFTHLHLSVGIKMSAFIPQAYEKMDGTDGRGKTKQNKTMQSTATRTIYTFLSILKLYCAY
jgi:hypothetical protein